MRKSELFAQILECVAFETEIAKEQILSKDKFQDVVDARYMLVHFCHKNGMYTTDIARMMRFSRRAYEEGFEEGRREGRGGYGERGGYGQGGGYGERGEYDRGGYEYDDAYGERRGVRGTGPYSRYRRR